MLVFSLLGGGYMSDGGIYTAMSGNMATSKQLDNTANNLANITTTGYKKDKTVFKKQLAKIRFDDINEIQAQNTEMPPRVLPIDKHNVMIDENFTEFTQGKLEKTDNPLDLAINGNGFFKIKTPDGIRYTKDGSFQISKDGLLVTSDGYFVLDENDNEINIDKGKKLTVNQDGTIYQNKEEISKLALKTFNNLNTLKKIGKNLFRQTNNNEQEIDAKVETYQGFLESSNVNPVEEMVNLISLQRQFELNAKTIEGFSEMDKKATSDLGRIG